jgi:hypothetical protein
MNNSKPGVHIVETILPTIEDESNVCVEENGIIPKCEPEIIKYETLDENGFIHTQNGFLVMASVPQVKTEMPEKSYPAYSDKVRSRKQYSSATIVGARDVVPVCCDDDIIHVHPSLRIHYMTWLLGLGVWHSVFWWIGVVQLRLDGTCAETRFLLSAKWTSPCGSSGVTIQ